MSQGMNMVSWRDYAGVDGFGAATVEDLNDLKKALTAGNDINNPGAAAGQGFPLRVESLERTLKNTTFRMEHVRFWRGIPKGPAFNTVEEFNQISGYGDLNLNAFINEGALPEEVDSTYIRNYSIVKFLGVTKRVSHVMNLVKPAHGNVLAQETVAATIHLLRRLELSLFFARSDLDPVQWDGLEKMIEDGAAAANIIDLRGQPLSEDVLMDAALTIQDAPNFGTPTHLFLNPKAKADLVKTFFPKSRYDLFAKPDDGMIGLNIQGITTPAGDIRLEPDVFLTDGAGEDGALPLAASGDASKRPATPVAAAFLINAPVVLNSQFVASDVGTYFWHAVAVNSFGQSLPVAVGTGAPLAGGSASWTLSPPGGTPQPRYYKIYRTAKNAATGTARLILRLPNTAGMGALAVTDLNARLPGTTSAFMLQFNSENIMFKQLAPMIKVPIATIDTSIRWMQLLYGVMQLYTPRHNVVIRNVGRAPGFVGSP